MGSKANELQRFLSSFGLNAYEEHAVPTGDNFPGYPLLTYEGRNDTLKSGSVPMALNVYYRSDSWSEINAKVQEISTTIGEGGKILPCTNGAIWVKRGTPFAQAMDEASDNAIKRVYITLSVDFLTAD